MTSEANKELAKEFFDSISNGNLKRVVDLLHDDLAWWSAGGENLAFSGVRDKPAFIQSMTDLGEIFPQGMKLSPTSMLAEGDRVSVELAGHATLNDGRSYENLYHMLLTFEGEKIIAVKEYHDTLYAKIVLIDGQVANSPV